MKLLLILRMIINAFQKPKQHVRIKEIPEGRILDIGGGGEGIIAQAGGANVIAVDKLISEIIEAKDKAPCANWMVADGTSLPFATGCLGNATAFFSCMYMPEEVKQSVFQETRRVLKESGELWVWDVNMASKEKVFAIRLQAELPDNQSIKTTYGVKAKNQSVDTICSQLQEAGFEINSVCNTKYWFFITASNMLR